jgi:hypothetical protein
MVKKDLIIAVLATFCLTATLFIIVPTRSQTAQYDPWVDLDEDGQISIYDVVQLTSIYGKTGDPARNVNVTNWPTQPAPKTIIVCQNYSVTGDPENDTKEWLPFVAHVEGYGYVSVFLAAIKRGMSLTATLYWCPSCLNVTYGSYSASLGFSALSWGTYCYTNCAVGSPDMRFKVHMPDGSVEMTIVLYCFN